MILLLLVLFTVTLAVTQPDAVSVSTQLEVESKFVGDLHSVLTLFSRSVVCSTSPKTCVLQEFFDESTEASFGDGASCAWIGHSCLTLAVYLGSGASVLPKDILYFKEDSIKYKNGSNTETWTANNRTTILQDADNYNAIGSSLKCEQAYSGCSNITLDAYSGFETHSYITYSYFVDGVLAHEGTESKFTLPCTSTMSKNTQAYVKIHTWWGTDYSPSCYVTGGPHTSNRLVAGDPYYGGHWSIALALGFTVFLVLTWVMLGRIPEQESVKRIAFYAIMLSAIVYLVLSIVLSMDALELSTTSNTRFKQFLLLLGFLSLFLLESIATNCWKEFGLFSWNEHSEFELATWRKLSSFSVFCTLFVFTFILYSEMYDTGTSESFRVNSYVYLCFSILASFLFCNLMLHISNAICNEVRPNSEEPVHTYRTKTASSLRIFGPLASFTHLISVLLWVLDMNDGGTLSESVFSTSMALQLVTLLCLFKVFQPTDTISLALSEVVKVKTRYQLTPNEDFDMNLELTQA